jgi:hypothetical protein
VGKVAASWRFVGGFLRKTQAEGSDKQQKPSGEENPIGLNQQ